MKELTSFELVHTIASHSGDTRTCEIKVSKVFHLADDLEPHHIICRLGAGSFMELHERFPKDVIVERQSITLNNIPELKKRLDVVMRYFQDEELYDIVWKTWQKV